MRPVEFDRLQSVIDGLQKQLDELKKESDSELTQVIRRESITSKTAIELVRMLRGVIMPWDRDDSSPPRYVRKNALGEEVGRVDAWLGGYGDPHEPHKHGWGYKAVIRMEIEAGIVEVDADPPMGGFRDREEREDFYGIRSDEAKKEAMQRVDDFLFHCQPTLRLLDD